MKTRVNSDELSSGESDRSCSRRNSKSTPRNGGEPLELDLFDWANEQYRSIVNARPPFDLPAPLSVGATC
jgi:hypothetical protein